MKQVAVTLTVTALWVGAFGQGQFMKYDNTSNGWQIDTSQNFMPYVKNIFQQTKFIFEGEVINKRVIDKVDGEGTVYEMNISKVFRGSLPENSVELIIKKHVAQKQGGDVIIYMPVEDYPTPNKGIYFIVGDAVSGSSIQVRALNTISDLSLPIPYDKAIKFESNNEIYSFIENHGRLTILNDTETKKKQPLNSLRTQTEEDSIKQIQNKLLYEERKRNYHNYMEQRMKIINAQQKEEIKE